MWASIILCDIQNFEISKVVHRFQLSDLKSYFRQTKYILMMTEEGSTKILNFMTPGAEVFVLGRGHISQWKCIISLKFLFSNMGHGWDTQRNDQGRVYKNYRTSGQGFFVSGRGHKVKMQYFFLSSLSTLRHGENKLSMYIVMMTKGGSNKIFNFLTQNFKNKTFNINIWH